MKLTKAQIRWLNDTRPYSNPYRDRTFRALIDKGVVKVADHDFSGSGKCGYIVTPKGQAALDAVNG